MIVRDRFSNFFKNVENSFLTKKTKTLSYIEWNNKVEYFFLKETCRIIRINPQNETRFKESVIKYNNPTSLFNFIKPNTTSKFKMVCFVFESKNKLLAYIHEF